MLFSGEREVDGEKPQEPFRRLALRLVRQPQGLLGLFFE
jgi:hypothetical protein